MMRANVKWLVVVILVVVLAVVFGLAGNVALPSGSVSPQQESSSSVTHLMYPPTFDSGWMDITDKLGQSFTLTHDLNTTEALVDVVGRRRLTNGDHKLFFGSTIYIPAGWNRTYKGPSWGRSLVQTGDGGYAIAGYKWVVEPVNVADFWLVKTDAAGNMQWNKTYGGTNSDVACSVVQTLDGGYAIAGRTSSYGAGLSDFWLVKTNAIGNLQWNKTYGGTHLDLAYSMIQTLDGGYAIAGETSSYGAGSDDFWLVKTDSSGNVQWNQTYGGNYAEIAYSIIQTTDWGGYALAGFTDSYGAGDYDFWLVKTDVTGHAEWNKTYGGTYEDIAYSVVQTDDGGYAIAGYTKSYGAGDYDSWLVKTDLLGNHLANRTYGGTDDDRAYSVVQVDDGAYVLVGDTQSRVGYEELWLVKTDMADLGYESFSVGLSMIDFNNSTITFYRGRTDPYWNYVRIRIWTIQEPTWQYGDIDMDGFVDDADLFILARNYWKTVPPDTAQAQAVASISAATTTAVATVAVVLGLYRLRKKQTIR